MPKITTGNTTETDTENHFAPLNAPIIIPTSTAHVMVPRNVKETQQNDTRTMAPQAADIPASVSDRHRIHLV